MSNTGVTGLILPPNTDFEHARVMATYFAYAFWPTTDTYIYHAKSRLNTPVWGSLRLPNYIMIIKLLPINQINLQCSITILFMNIFTMLSSYRDSKTLTYGNKIKV